MLRAVATDGHRLAQAQVEAPDGTAGMPAVIVPRKTVAEAQKLLDGLEGDVSVEVSDAKIRITAATSTGEVVLTSKLIDGTFPDYNRVIPTGNDKELRIDRESFSQGRRPRLHHRVGPRPRGQDVDGRRPAAPDRQQPRFRFGREEELPVGYEASALDIGFNSRYLLDIAGQLTADEATFMLADPGSPTLIRDAEQSKEGGAGASALYVLMPMRV